MNATNIKLICFDMDGTLIENNKWYDLNIAMGIAPDEDYSMYTSYSQGELPYEEWIRKLESFYKGAPLNSKNHIVSVLQDFTLQSGAEGVVSYLHGSGFKTALITGSFDVTAKAVAQVLNIEYVFANTECVFDERGVFSRLQSKGDETLSKLKMFEELCLSLGLQPNECAMVGDGGNDLSIFDLTGNGITFTRCKDTMKSRAAVVIEALEDLKQIF